MSTRFNNILDLIKSKNNISVNLGHFFCQEARKACTFLSNSFFLMFSVDVVSKSVFCIHAFTVFCV